MIQISKNIKIFSAVLTVVLLVVSLTPLALAQDDLGPADPAIRAGGTTECGGVEIGFSVGCKDTGNPITDYLAAILSFLARGVGLVVVLMLIVGGIQYIASAGNPQGIEAAKKRLTNAIMALLLFIFMAAILNFLVPGGIL